MNALSIRTMKEYSEGNMHYRKTLYVNLYSVSLLVEIKRIYKR